MNIGFDENTAIEEFIIDIRDKNQVIKHRYALKSKDIEKNILMSEHYIELEEFELDVFIKFARTDYIIWEGEKYMIKEDYLPDEINKINYKYTLRFDHWTTFLQDDTFYYTNQNLEEADWSLMSNAATHFQLIADNANRYFGVNTFNVGTIEFAEMKLLQFSKVSIWNAATLIADAYKAEWYLTGTTFHLVKKFSYGSEVDFEAEVSVEKMDRSEGENSEKYTRILSFGSTRSLTANYRYTTPTEAVDAIYQKRLRIPASKGNFIDIRPNLSPEEVKSAVVIFDEIYPKRIGTMSSISTVEYTDTDETTGVVTKWNAYRYKDTGLTFKEEYRLPGIELRIVFQSGALNGTDYEVKFNPLGKASTDPESQLFEIIRNEDYGKALPNNTSKPQNGDTFILYGFDIKLVSDQYIPAAELELYNTAVQWLADNNKDRSVFECPTMIEYFEANEMDLEIGQKVKLIHSQFESGFRSSRIQGYEKHLLDKYQATYTVGDNAAYSWPKDIEESIKELQIAGVTYQATGRNGVYLIKQFDNTPASDFNAYSAKASDARYLNRISGGTVQGDTTFQKKVKAKEVISDQFGNETFMPGMFGNGFKFWVENGLSFGQLDYLTITREMLISVLTVAEVKSVDGGMIISAANMICNKTEETTNGYKCYFDNDNGNIPNKFVVGDQAICRRFNGANVKYYWRLVLEIGTNHILLSKTDKDGSGIPSAKDNIVQFGNRTNTQRQFAVYTVGYGDAGTYYYYGVNSYDLTGKAKTYFDKTGARIDGDSIIFSSSGKSATTVINESKQDAISTAATDATNKVNAIQVGGSNLFRDSANFGSPYWASRAYVTLLNEYYRECRIYRTSIAWSAMTYKNYDNINLSKEHTISFYVKSDVDLSSQTGNLLSYGIANGKVISAINKITTDWQRLSITGSLTGDVNGIRVELSTNINSGYIYFCGFKLEEGNKATTWTPAPEDVQANIDAANTAATNAATAAATAQTSANTANALLTDIASDNKLTPNEKSSVRQEWNVIAAEISINNTQADTFGITTEKSTYNSAFQTLANYLNNGTTWSTGVPSWISDANLSVTTTIVGNTFRANWKAYYDARTILLNAIAKKSKQLADAAQSSADTANAGLLTKVSYSEYNAQMTIVNNQISSKVSQTDFNSLNQRVGTTESQITQQSGQISSVVTQVDTAQTAADNASLMARAMTYGKMLYKDPSFTSGLNSISAYNNLSNGNVSVSRISKLSDTPTTSSYCLEIKTIGSVAPGFGGFYFATTARVNAIFICRFIAKIPTGLNVNFASNSFGTGGTYKWLTSVTGTGTWQEYICMVTCGATGTFSTTNFFNLSGTFSPSSSNPLLWYLAYATVYDITDAEVNFQDLINTAQTTANSKNKTYYQDAQPTAPSGGFSVGDIWQKVTLTDITGIINSDTTKNVCRLEYRWNGTTWVQINVNISGSYVTQTNENYNVLVTKTGINGLGVGETLKSLIDQTPGQIELAVSAIKIGGRNLIPNTNKGTTGWNKIVQSGNVTYTEALQLGVSAVKATTSGFTSGYHVLYHSINRSLLQNTKQYTLSIDVFCEFSTTANFQILSVSGINGLINFGSKAIIANTWTHIELTATSNTNTATDQVLYIGGFGQNASVTFANLKLEEGNKATTWSPAPEDIQLNIDAANTAANNAATAASNADAKATTANNLLTDIANDNKLDPAEKQSTKKEQDIIVSEYSKNIAQANSFTVSTTVYTSAYNALSSYITPLLSNLNTTSDIVGTTFRSNFKSYYDARTDLLNAVSTKAKAIADSKTTLDEVASSLTIEKNVIKLSSKNIVLDGITLAEAIHANALNVGVGNCIIDIDGKISAKEALISGLYKTAETGERLEISPSSKSFKLYTSNGYEVFKLSYAGANIASIEMKSFNSSGTQTGYFSVSPTVFYTEGTMMFKGLPTSSTNLPSGTVWRDGTTLKIVP